MSRTALPWPADEIAIVWSSSKYNYFSRRVLCYPSIKGSLPKKVLIHLLSLYTSHNCKKENMTTYVPFLVHFSMIYVSVHHCTMVVMYSTFLFTQYMYPSNHHTCNLPLSCCPCQQIAASDLTLETIWWQQYLWNGRSWNGLENCKIKHIKTVRMRIWKMGYWYENNPMATMPLELVVLEWVKI